MWNKLSQEFLARLPRTSANWIGNDAQGLPMLAPPTMDWESCIAELNHYRTYTDDWDGQGAILGKPAAPIVGEVVDSALALTGTLRSLAMPPPHFTFPGVTGTVGMTWDFAEGGSLEIEVIDSSTVDVFFDTPGKEVEYLVLTETVGV